MTISDIESLVYSLIQYVSEYAEGFSTTPYLQLWHPDKLVSEYQTSCGDWDRTGWINIVTEEGIEYLPVILIVSLMWQVSNRVNSNRWPATNREWDRRLTT
jgi:hypothetical protein